MASAPWMLSSQPHRHLGNTDGGGDSGDVVIVMMVMVAGWIYIDVLVDVGWFVHRWF